MNNRSLKETLSRYIDAQFPIIYINSFEEAKVDEIIKASFHGREIFEWNGAKGLVDFDTKIPFPHGCNFNDGSSFKDIVPLEDTLSKLLEIGDLVNSMIVIKDAHLFIGNPIAVSILKEIALRITKGMDTTIIMVSPVVQIPLELEKYITILDVPYLTFDEIKRTIIEFIEVNSMRKINERLLEDMAVAFKGLSEFEIYNILALAYASDGDISRKDLHLIFDQKQQMIKKSGILDMIPLKESIEDIGGLENLKNWLKRKSTIFKNLNKAIEFGVDMPKGVLIAGVPGCGKSLNAKVAANLFEVPLLRLDMGRLMGKYVGESESNMRRAISLAEAISPCVLWIDELEKAFAGIGESGGNGEVTTRLFGNFLTWLQEKESSVFVVATANDIIKLPTELMRKGRFDEIFYVGLPNENERKRIFEIHIGKRRKGDLSKIDINELVSKTKGYSGADIEGVIKESIESVFVENRSELTTQDILNVIKNTHSLSEIMKKPIEEMSKEYENRKFKNASI